MNTKAQGAMLLLSSIIISSVLTYILTKAKYEKRAVPKPDIQVTEEPKEQKKEIELQQNSQEDKNDVIKYAEKYIRKNSELTREYMPEQEQRQEIELIDGDIFDTNPAYDTVTFTLFSDGVLVNEQQKIVIDYQNNVGREVIERFNEYEENGAVYVRNHKHQMDYEILRDPRSFTEAFGGGVNGKS